MRTARTLASAVLALAASGCLTFTEVSVETPIRPKIDASPFSRVYIAGSLPSGSEDVDTNLETVRLLRSQLKNKGGMRIIEADVLPLVDAAKPVPAENQPAHVQIRQQRRYRRPLRDAAACIFVVRRAPHAAPAVECRIS